MRSAVFPARPLLIGQAPGPASDPAEPLSGRCGARLADLCGLGAADFLARFDRVNLLPKFPGKNGKGDRFPMDEARRGAIDLLLFGRLHGRRTVMLGENVARAFGFPVPGIERLRWNYIDGSGFHVALCPHPSGVSRWWNEAANVRAARAFWRDLAGAR